MAVKNNDLVVIFKSVLELDDLSKDIYYETFSATGFDVVLIPVLDFEYINLDQFLIKIKNPNDYTGIIFSSPRCVSGLKLAIGGEGDSNILEKWKGHKHFVVGEKTAVCAESLGLAVNGKEAGNGDKLVEIISKDNYNKPFLYPMGSLTQKTFKSKLNECNIKAEEIMIYKTKPHAKIEENLKNVKNHKLNKNLYFIYFSPSGVNFSYPILKELCFDLNNIKFVAIGPTTEAALRENKLNVDSVAIKPNPSALLDAVLSLRTNFN